MYASLHLKGPRNMTELQWAFHFKRFPCDHEASKQMMRTVSCLSLQWTKVAASQRKSGKKHDIWISNMERNSANSVLQKSLAFQCRVMDRHLRQQCHKLTHFEHCYVWCSATVPVIRSTLKFTHYCQLQASRATNKKGETSLQIKQDESASAQLCTLQQARQAPQSRGGVVNVKPVHISVRSSTDTAALSMAGWWERWGQTRQVMTQRPVCARQKR